MDAEILNRLYLKSLNLISYSPKTTNEVLAKLKQYVSKEDITNDEKEQYILQITQLLKDESFLDDEKLAADMVELNRISKNPKSRQQLKQKMYKKRFPPELIENALGSISHEDEEETALEILRRRYKHRAEDSQKAIKYLISKGFNFSTAKRAVDILFNVK